ncbi:MAG TPA: hypothetical protein VEC99_10490, partial [Clostridia bacterium]|nr:hypothetical protein [Clostridia bacterium]
MKRIIPLVICLFVGGGIGWYFGYTRPTAKNQRELLAQYQYVRDTFRMTDAEMAELGPKIPQFFEDMKRQDEMAAAFAFSTFKILARGDVEGAKTRLLKAVGSYYRLYHGKGGDTNILAKIEEAAQKYPEVATEIARKVE